MPTSAASALTNKLFQVITGGNGVPPGSFISFVGGGIPLDAAHLSWAAKVPPYVGCQDADNAYAFSTLVNTIPTAAGPWAAGSANMAKAFRDIWLMNAEVPNIPLTPAQVTERDTAQTLVDQKYDAYTQYQNDWANANMMFQLATLAPRDAQYFQNLLLARSQVTAALTAWQAKGAKAEFEHAMATVQHYNDLGFVNAIQNLKNDYDLVYNANVTSGTQRFAPVQLFPNNFLSAGGPKWNKFNLSETEFSRFQSSSSHSYSSGADVGFLFWTVASGGSSGWSHRNQLNINTAQLNVGFEFLRVRLDRSDWFDSFLLTSNAWWWHGATKSNPTFGGPVFSNGAPVPSCQGQWQMIPTDMIVARNLVVDVGAYDLQHSDFASHSQSASSAGFWIFSTSSHSASSTSSSYTHTFQSKSRLVAAQPQIVAFICQLMPKEPNPDYHLLPSR